MKRWTSRIRKALAIWHLKICKGSKVPLFCKPWKESWLIVCPLRARISMEAAKMVQMKRKKKKSKKIMLKWGMRTAIGHPSCRQKNVPTPRKGNTRKKTLTRRPPNLIKMKTIDPSRGLYVRNTLNQIIRFRGIFLRRMGIKYNKRGQKIYTRQYNTHTLK